MTGQMSHVAYRSPLDTLFFFSPLAPLLTLKYLDLEVLIYFIYLEGSPSLTIEFMWLRMAETAIWLFAITF